MKFLSLVIALLLSTSAFAGIQGYNGTANLGVFNKIKCHTGMTCTKVGDVFSMVSSPTISTGSMSITGANNTDDAYIIMAADRADDNGDSWKLISQASDNSFLLQNNTSGSYVTKFTLTTGGNATIAGTATVTGATTFTGGVVASAGQFTNFGRAYDGLTTGTSTTPSATVVYMSQVWVPANATITGVKVNNGATVGTDKYIVALFNSSGAAVANSTTAGTTTAGADAYQTIAFTGTYAAKGPAVYWIGLYVNGTTDRFRSIAAGGEGRGLAGSVTTQTFGTVATVVLPTTFTADKGPVAFLY